jgi:hypothetical protein
VRRRRRNARSGRVLVVVCRFGRSTRELGRCCRGIVVHWAFFKCQTVDSEGGRRLYSRFWRAAAWRDGASAKPLTVYAVNHPAMTCGHGGCAGFGGSGTCRRRSREVPGCLISESEERETWTAESLRAAFANGEGLPSSLDDRGREETSAVLRFKVFYIVRSRERAACRDLVKRCDQPRSILFNLRV